MMLEALNSVLRQLPNLLDDASLWDSLIVNLRKPHTYRVYTKLDGLRVCLHKFDKCATHEAFPHPHPWPGAFAIMKGEYKMSVGYSKDRVSKPEDVMTVILPKYSQYEITNPLTWHAVVPIKTTYTVMVNGETWTPEVAHTEVRTTKGKDLDKLSGPELLEHLAKFKKMINSYLKAK